MDLGQTESALVPALVFQNSFDDASDTADRLALAELRCHERVRVASGKSRLIKMRVTAARLKWIGSEKSGTIATKRISNAFATVENVTAHQRVAERR